jgi:hypothetical protein
MAKHEIARNGHNHLLVYKIVSKTFREDVELIKKIIEGMIGEAVIGIRAARFGITEDAGWVLYVNSEVDFDYGNSVFHASRGHGGM